MSFDYASLGDGAVKRSSPVNMIRAASGLLATGSGMWAARHVLSAGRRFGASANGEGSSTPHGAFFPRNGVQAVLVRPVGPAPLSVLLPGLFQHKEAPAAVFWYATAVKLPPALQQGLEAVEGWVYGAVADTPVAGLAYLLANPTGEPADVLKGRLLSWPGHSLAEKLGQTDQLSGYGGSAQMVRDTVAVVLQDGTARSAYWYYAKPALVDEATVARPGSLAYLQTRADQSWLHQLTPDPETDKFAPNKVSREVKSGHYVLVSPDPLPSPELVAVSPDMARELGLDRTGWEAPEFLRFFSGDQSAAPGFVSWATPYALSIYGSIMTSNCPFGTGNGYGDGRAISVAEVLMPSPAGNGQQSRWELQLKGSGTTPFCRGGDGRAVLRSSIREFLVSEAMYHLGVSTTRALCLVSSPSQVVRPWYSGKPLDAGDIPSLTDPRLAQYDLATRKQIVAQIRAELGNPDCMRHEPTAITTRVSPSFIRVGHLELHARRVQKLRQQGQDVSLPLKQLAQLFDHLVFREYPELQSVNPRPARVVALLRAFSKRLAKLTADWVRVGYVQGNFNSDNCLVGGRTMDYGPFGFIEKFTPYWNMWTGGGQHFGFLNQPTAGAKNFGSLANALAELLRDEPAYLQEAQTILNAHGKHAETALHQMWAEKLGFPVNSSSYSSALSDRVLALLESMEADYPLFWRQLAVYPEKYLHSTAPANDEELFKPLLPVFYGSVTTEDKRQLMSWLRLWLGQLHVARAHSTGKEVSALMRQKSPKYVPREWMLVEAYTRVYEKKDYSAFQELVSLFSQPYAEQSAEREKKFYRRAPDHVLNLGGSAFMS